MNTVAFSFKPESCNRKQNGAKLGRIVKLHYCMYTKEKGGEEEKEKKKERLLSSIVH